MKKSIAAAARAPEAAPDSWLDTVAAVPLVGVQLVPDWGLRLPEHAEAIVGRLESAVRGRMRTDNPWHLSIDCSDGLRFELTVENMTAQFAYPARATSAPGALDSVAVPAVRPYSSLLDTTIDAFGEVLGALHTNRRVRLRRIGVIASTSVDRSSPPPGVRRLLDHLDGFWPNPLTKCQAVFLAPLSKSKGSEDRCHHHVDFDSTSDPRLMRIQLDWQRVLGQPLDATVAKLDQVLHQARRDAVAYFDEFGRGAR